MERLPIVLHRTLNTHHSSGRLQSTNAHAPLHIRREHLILESTDGLLEGLVLVLKASVTVNFSAEGTITELPDGLVHAIIPHVVSIKEPKNIGGDERGRYVNVNHRHGMDFAVVGGCHGSAGTPLGTHANGEDSGLEESRKTICT
jgi:hypothetical protein